METAEPGRRAWLLSAACALLVPSAGAGCAGSAPPVAAAAAGAVSWRDAAGRPVDPAALLAGLRDVPWLLLGEVHDNPSHHRVRAELLAALLADGRPTRVVFEQIDRGHDAALAAATAASRANRNRGGATAAATTDAERLAGVETVVDAGQLDRRGWGWPLHRPLFAAALAAGADIAGGNLSRADAAGVVRGGAAAVPAGLQRWFDPARPEGGWREAQQAQAQREVDDGHCGALPPSMLAPMTLAQRARDAALADAMLGGRPWPAGSIAGTRTVLIAGNGHVRADIGVPHYLRAAGIAADDIVAVGLFEHAVAEDAASMSPPDMTTTAAYRFLGWTAPVARDDPCSGFVPPGGAPASGVSRG